MATQKAKKPKKPRNYTVGDKSGSKPAAKSTRATAAKSSGSPTAKASTKSVAAKPSASRRKKPEPNMQERMEGLQGWMAEIERKQGRMTYFGAAACGLAVLASAAALYLGVTNKNDSATKDDLDQLSEQVDGIQAEVKKATETELKGINESLGSIDQRLEDLKQKQAQDAADIATLQSQGSTAKAGTGAGAGLNANK